MGGKSGLKHGTTTKGGQNGVWVTFWSILGSIWEAKTAQKLIKKQTEKRAEKIIEKKTPKSCPGGWCGGPAKPTLLKQKADLYGKWNGFGTETWFNTPDPFGWAD